MEQIKKNRLTLNQAKSMVDASIRDIKDGFVIVGCYLRIIREDRLWEKYYSSFREFLEANYEKDKSWASRCISLYEQFGKEVRPGELPALAEPYRDYSASQLIEMVSMTEDQRQQVTPDMPVRRIREMKPKRKQEPEPLAEEPATEIEEEQIPGQMDVTDYPGVAATPQREDPAQWMEEPEEEQEEEAELDDLPQAGADLVRELAGLVAGRRREWLSRLPQDQRWAENIARYQAEIVAAETGNPILIGNGIKAAVCTGIIEFYEGDKDLGICTYARFLDQVRTVVEEQGRDTVPEPEDTASGQPGTEAADSPEKVATSQLPEPEKDIREELKTDGEDSGQKAPGVGTAVGTAVGTEPEKFVPEDTETGTEPGKTVPDGTETGTEAGNTGREPEGYVIDTEFVEVPEATWKPPAAYDRRILEEMIRKAEEMMEKVEKRRDEVKPGFYTKHAMQLEAYRNLLGAHERQEAPDGEPEEEAAPVQPELPVLKNNDQRKAWLRNYRDWGLWYEDQNIGVRYYRYVFDNGAVLIVDEYQHDRDGIVPEYTSSFLHLVGGPKPGMNQSNGCSMWPYHKRYCRHSDSESDLVEFLKALQRKGEQKR